MPTSVLSDRGSHFNHLFRGEVAKLTGMLRKL